MNYSKDEIVVLSISAGVILVIALILGFLLRNKSDKIRKIPLLVITIILLALEVVKQILSIATGYSFWALPLHFCSTYFIWFSLAHFTKGKFQKAMQSVAFVASLYLVALFYFDPVSIIGHACSNVFETFFTFHTFFFHHLVLLYFVLTIALKQVDLKLSHSIHFLVSMAIYYAVAVTCAHLLQVNYMNILTSSIPFMESLRLAIGQVGYTIILGIIVICAGAIIIALGSIIQKKIQEKQNSKKIKENAQ